MTPEPSEESRIVTGPSPDDRGCVVFTVRVDSADVEVTTSPLGTGVSASENLDVGNKALRLVDDYWRTRPTERLTLLREAAQLRRNAGNPPLAANTRSEDVRLIGSPKRSGSGAKFGIQTPTTEMRVLVLADGGLIDDCDSWENVTDAERDAAFNAALTYIFAHPEEADGLGLDANLLRLLWT
jgi:hypothetical protein